MAVLLTMLMLELLKPSVHGDCCKSQYLLSVISTFTLNCVCSLLVSYLHYVMVGNAGPRCSVIFAIFLPFTCVSFVPCWKLLGHILGRSTSLMLSCWLCTVTPRLLRGSLLTSVWSSLGTLPESRIGRCLGKFLFVTFPPWSLTLEPQERWKDDV